MTANDPIVWSELLRKINSMSAAQFFATIPVLMTQSPQFAALHAHFNRTYPKTGLADLPFHQHVIELAEETLPYNTDNINLVLITLEKNICHTLQRLHLTNNFAYDTNVGFKYIDFMKIGEIRHQLKNGANRSQIYTLWNTIFSYLLTIAHYFTYDCQPSDRKLSRQRLLALFDPFDENFKEWLREFVCMIRSLHQIYGCFPLFLLAFLEQYAIPDVFFSK